MEARLLPVAFAAAALLASGANYRSENFIVHSSSSDQIAQEVCTAAEKYRRDLAIEWLGRELPPWREPCPINLSRVHPRELPSGKTSFFFRQGEPIGWDMEVNGPRERVLDSVLPHEITHTVFATHFGAPLPRWADEGGSTTVEHVSEKNKQDVNLIRFLKGNKGIAFNTMFAMKEYPREMLPLYSQGYSLTRFLIMHGGDQGKPKFVNYVGDGMRQNNWTKATHDHYGFQSLSELQLAWLEWVKKGSPEILPARGLAAEVPRPQEEEPYPVQPAGGTRGIEDLAAVQGYQTPPRPSTFAAEPAHQDFQPRPGEQSVARPSTAGWYARQKEQPKLEKSVGREVNSTPEKMQPVQPNSNRLAPDNRAPLPGRKLLMEWSRPKRGMDDSQPVYAADERNSDLAAGSLYR